MLGVASLRRAPTLRTLVERARASAAFGDEHFDKLFPRPSPIGSALIDLHRLLGRPPLTRAPVHDDLDVLPPSENASNLVFEMGMRPTDDDVGHPTTFPFTAAVVHSTPSQSPARSNPRCWRDRRLGR